MSANKIPIFNWFKITVKRFIPTNKNNHMALKNTSNKGLKPEVTTEVGKPLVKLPALGPAKGSGQDFSTPTVQYSRIFLQTVGFFAAIFSAAELLNQFIVKYDIGLWIRAIMAFFIIGVLFSDVIQFGFERFVLFLQSILEKVSQKK